MNRLNFSRIILFAIVLLVLHILIGAFVPNFEEYEEPSARLFWCVIGYLVQAVVVIATFAKLARVQKELLYVHAVSVFVLCELLGYAVMFALFGGVQMSPFVEVVIDYIVLTVWAVIGAEIGQRLRISTENKA